MSQRRAKIRREVANCCPAHSTDAITQQLADKWIQDVRDTAVNGGINVIAAIPVPGAS